MRALVKAVLIVAASALAAACPGLLEQRTADNRHTAPQPSASAQPAKSESVEEVGPSKDPSPEPSAESPSSENWDELA